MDKRILFIEVLEARIAPAFAPVFNLTGLDGTNGFGIPGAASGHSSGQSVSNAGDVNGDGYDDLIIGAPGVSRAYVVFGKNGSFDANFELGSLSGANGFRIDGSNGGVSAAGDVNGDGFDDLILGAPGNGRSYVVFGKSSGFAPSVSLFSLDGASGFQLFNSDRPFGELGRVSGAGDVNGDGFDDVIVGDRLDPGMENGNFPGAAFVVFGKASGFGTVFDVQDLNGTNGFKLNGSGERSYAGLTVSAAGDVNGDGFDDVLLGGSYRKPAYLVFGKASGFDATIDLGSLNGTTGTIFSGSETVFGTKPRVSGAGDLNGDGLSDMIIHAGTGAYQESNPVTTYVVFGNSSGFGALMHLPSLTAAQGFKIQTLVGRNYGVHSVSDAGDVNGDGFDDLMVGSYRGDSPNGAISGVGYVIFGKAGSFGTSVNVAALNGTNGFRVDGLAAGDALGIAVSGAGDVNGDGFDDVLIGASGEDVRATNAGASYVIFGGAGLRLGDASIIEGNSGAADLVFTVTLPTANSESVSVRYSTRDGTAHAGSDYVAIDNALLTFAPGETQKTIAVPVMGDGIYELDESFSVVLSDASNSPIVRATAAGLIRNEDTAPQLAIAPSAGAEGHDGNTPLTFTVSLSAVSGAPVTVQYESASGSAGAGTDYVAPTPGLLTFAPGEITKTIPVNVLGDGAIENHEHFSVILSQPQGATISTQTATGTILNDDTAVRIISPSAKLESNSSSAAQVFTVSLEQASALAVTVDFSSADGTASSGSDYQAVSGTLTFAPGETAKSISLEVFGDAAAEDHESFSVLLSNVSGASVAVGSATATILNDDTSVRIVGPDALLESDSGLAAHIFTVTLEKASALNVTVGYSTADGEAVLGSDYSIASGTLTFAPGQTSKTVTVQSSGDTEIEDHESFTVALSNAINGTVAVRVATAIILNDETDLSITSTGILEGPQGITSVSIFTVSLAKASALPVSVNFSTSDESATGGSDYDAVSGTLTFAPGELTKEVVVPVHGDGQIEAHEDFAMLLSAPVNAGILDGKERVVASILNDDTLISITDVSLIEGHTGTRTMTFEVSLTAPSALPVSVTYSSADGTALAGVDYLPLTDGVLTFAPGEVTANLTVEVLGDTTAESSESFEVLLSSAENAAIGKSAGTGTILGDDVMLTRKRTATFTDTDGDLVTIRLSKGTLNVENFTLFPSGSGFQLALVDLGGGTEFERASLSITAIKARASAIGDGLVDVGFINAAGLDLARVTVEGDLGRIVVGDGLDPRAALVTLKAGSLGLRGLSTQLPGGNAQSEIDGALTALKLTGNLQDSTLSVSGRIGSIAIKGSVFGSSIQTDGRIGSIMIGGDLGRGEAASATISARGVLNPAAASTAVAISKISIGGSVDYAQILAGYDRTGAAVNADAGIGRVTVAQNWIASSLVAGATRGSDGFFGSDGGELIEGGNAIVARIASVVIKGVVNGTQESGDHFGFVAEEIRAFKAGGALPRLQVGPSNDLAGLVVGVPGDALLREVV